MGRYKTDNSQFGTSVSAALAGARTRQSDLADALQISRPRMSQLMTGRTKPSPQWVDLIADTLNLSDEQRWDLHLAAARDHGFKL